MSKPSSSRRTTPRSRRDFLKASALGTVGGTLVTLPSVHAAGSDVLKVGLVGCGGRGTGAAANALNADKNVKLVALGDAFGDRLESCLSRLQKDKAITAKVDVPTDRRFTGFDAYKGVIANCDVVLLCSPPHFRPIHVQAAVEAGKHMFAEKPVAVDPTGVRKVLAACEAAKKKNLSIVSGLCWRYHHGMRETFARIHEGMLGDIVAMQCTYNTGALWHRSLKEKQTQGWSDMEYQMRNWLYYTWLSGDHIVEQHIHSLDKMAWAMKNEYPVKAVGLGGRQVRTAPDYGHIFDHHAVVYEYANGVKLFSSCRQQAGCANDVSDHLMGTLGTCDVMRHTIKGKNAWRLKRDPSAPDDMYQNEHNELFTSIRQGKPINDGELMAKSSLMAIMGRVATYTGQVITWDKLLASKEDLSPPRYEFGPLPTPAVALPGQTKVS